MDTPIDLTNADGSVADDWFASAYGYAFSVRRKTRVTQTRPLAHRRLPAVIPISVPFQALLESQLPQGQLLSDGHRKLSVGIREEFRAPAGVRKSPRKEPAGHRRWLWGFRISADVGDGATAVEELWGECGQTAS
ncbi:hypothetical protein BQ8794_260029 [Mesorhizobium prunaredense]|uniref:Uncharacterized protein n=1 Tax=Mesorhizobium prunaredense TaxID=1631249 RepID=A0A1R3VA94_9HYPH|nr:hypothetical protein BQ8794_260029 [Mesorhizobium prunaredense]